MFGVFSKGGYIGSTKNFINGDPLKTFDNKEDAKLYARRMRKQLTIGERKYYRMSYITRQL